ncbi:hypothetical protein [Dysgonomonas sp. 511]|uniref:hypothetical protein n=1 Tax=Dysgonomonas sp. 511 TaxID=2302930 RepID=UPI0013CFEB87|nr:hypothetical protein [Dysgonomonas sp. 511]
MNIKNQWQVNRNNDSQQEEKGAFREQQSRYYSLPAGKVSGLLAVPDRILVTVLSFLFSDFPPHCHVINGIAIPATIYPLLKTKTPNIQQAQIKITKFEILN